MRYKIAAVILKDRGCSPWDAGALADAIIAALPELNTHRGDDVHPVEAAMRDDGWQPIETAPKDGAIVILSNKSGSWVGKYHAQYGSGYRPENPWMCMMLSVEHLKTPIDLIPTHWRPLPAAPTETLD
jgi:hypothetical protein